MSNSKSFTFSLPGNDRAKLLARILLSEDKFKGENPEWLILDICFLQVNWEHTTMVIKAVPGRENRIPERFRGGRKGEKKRKKNPKPQG